ncbi:MAG: hypothetical protein JKY56_27850 [Kofleriaceae bacterium]|nr:hypothetical protein [Kofleriaceae bacterium]
MKAIQKFLLASAVIALGACEGSTFMEEEPPPPPTDNPAPPDGTTGGEENTFDHPGGPAIWDYLERLAEEGPASFSSRMHSCPKMTYQNVGRLLASRGVDLNNNNNASAGFLWRNGESALGAPKLEVRSRESTDLTTAAAARLFDIFAQAAPEIIAAMPNMASCTIDGVGTAMFNEVGQCTLDGIACLTGVPATGAHLELCNLMISRASSPEVGRELAVAALAAAAHTCE